MTDPEYVAIEYAGHVTGVPARTLRRWAEAGKVPVMAGQRKRLIRLEDVRRLAAMTGHVPATADMATGHAGQATGHVAGDVVDDNASLPPAAVSPTPRAYLDEVRDVWLQPLVDQLGEARETIGRLKAERDLAAQERDTFQAELEQLRNVSRERNSARYEGDLGTTLSDDEPISTSLALTWRRWWRRITGARR